MGDATLQHGAIVQAGNRHLKWPVAGRVGVGADGWLRRLPGRVLRLRPGGRRHPQHRPSVAVAAGGHDGVLHLRHLLRHCRRGPAAGPSVPICADRGSGRVKPHPVRSVQPAGRGGRRVGDGGVRMSELPAGVQQLPDAVHAAHSLPVLADPRLRRAGRAVQLGGDRAGVAERLRAGRRWRPLLCRPPAKRGPDPAWWPAMPPRWR